MVATASCRESSRATEQAEVRRFIESYFSTWSAANMDAYSAHFSPSATVTLIEQGAVRWMMPLAPFIESQKRAVTSEKMTERMTSFDVHLDDAAASVTVDWTLETANETTTGVDRFILFKDTTGHWRIQALVFYNHAAQ
jgi:hypothetical protein